MKKLYAYGMRLRGYSPGCQPKDGFVCRLDSDKYHDILLYDRKLTEKEMRDYELDDLTGKPDPHITWGTAST